LVTPRDTRPASAAQCDVEGAAAQRDGDRRQRMRHQEPARRAQHRIVGMHQRPRWGTGEEVADHDQPVLANEDVVQDQRFAAGAEKAEHLLARISHTGVFLGGNLCGGWSSGVKKAAVVG